MTLLTPLQHERAGTRARYTPLELQDRKSPFSDAPRVVHVDLGMTTDEDAGTMDADEANDENTDGETILPARITVEPHRASRSCAPC